MSSLELFRAGRFEEAQRAADSALESAADDVEALVVRALSMLSKGKNQEALLLMRKTAERVPTHPQVQLALGRALQAMGQHRAATDTFKRAAAVDPTIGEPLMELARQALAANKAAEAFEQLQQAVRLSPDLGMAHFLLADLHLRNGRKEDAERHLRAAVEAMPTHAEALCNLGGVLRDRGNFAEATQILERAVQHVKLAPATFNLAMLRIDHLRWVEALDLLRASIAVDRKQPDAYFWMGNASMALGDAVEARKAYQAAIRLDPKFARPRWGLAMAQLPAVPETPNEQQAAVAAFGREVDRLKNWFTHSSAPDKYLAVAGQQPYYLAYVPGNHSAVLREYGSLCTSVMAQWAKTEGVARTPQKTGAKCRVGIVSAHVCNHSVWNALVRGWVEHLDVNQFELEIFHTGSHRDEQTSWASGHVKRLHADMGSWAHWAKAIANGNFDVLIYPEIGMDAQTARLASLRLAPVQLAAWGHPITTGLPTIDGFISAQAFEPMDAVTHYTEKLIALPGLGCSYRSFDSAPVEPDLASLGLEASDRLLLCPGTPFKYGPSDDALLIEIARRCNPCKLVFFRGQPVELAARLEQRLRRAFEASHLPFDDYVRFVPRQNQASFFGLLDRAVACLDTIEFSGFNTIMQAIERGAAVVAWEGKYMRGRLGSGIMRELGLSEWIVDSHEGYAERVAKLVDDEAARTRLKDAIVARRSSLFEQKVTVDALGEHLLKLVTQSA